MASIALWNVEFQTGLAAEGWISGVDTGSARFWIQSLLRMRIFTAMARISLEELYAAHEGKVSDKWSSYLAEYDRILSDYRDKPVRLLEIGVQNGGSLEIWSRFFPNAQKIVGCDINPDCARLSYKDPRIALVVGDANADEVQATVLRHAPQFDVIIDDGSHRSGDILKSFARYFPCVMDGGLFIAEDLHCSYWEEYEGGLFDPFSSIAFFKCLADVANHEHWGMEKKPSDVLSGFFEKYGFQMDDGVLQHVHSIEFVNSMCIIRKRKPEQNRLGRRFIAGSIEAVVPGLLSLHSTLSLACNQTHKAKESNQPMNQTTTTSNSRNKLCPCGSGKRYKHCCGTLTQDA